MIIKKNIYFESQKKLAQEMFAQGRSNGKKGDVR